jgi:3-oxoacyl-[acyl-carrier protein] reductase
MPQYNSELCRTLRNVVVTGGSRGIGLGIARVLAGSGFQVIAIARRGSESLEAAQAEIVEQRRGALQFQPYDLSNIDGIGDLVKSLSRNFGPLYGLVNNAGIGTAGLLANMASSDIEKLVRMNIVSPLTLTKYMVRSAMAGAAGGRIVNISSVVSATGYSGLSVYSATKASLIGFTRSLAREVGPLGMTVNAVSPGFVETEMTHDLTPAHRQQIARRSALQRMAEVADIAHAVAFLFSEKAQNITGTVMTVDAGNTA